MDHHYIVDGDLIQLFLELPRTQQERIALEMVEKYSVERIVELVEELSRIH